MTCSKKKNDEIKFFPVVAFSLVACVYNYGCYLISKKGLFINKMYEIQKKILTYMYFNYYCNNHRYFWEKL